MLIAGFLAIIAAGPAIYVYRYLMDSRRPRDITQPPEDTSWKSRRQLAINGAIVVAASALAVFVFTPEARILAKSEWFWPALLSAFGSFALGSVAKGWSDRTVKPLTNGDSPTFSRDDHPKRFWATMAWNAALGTMLFGVSALASHDNLVPHCDDPDTENVATLRRALMACDALAAEAGLDSEDRQDVLAARGRIFQQLGQDKDAIAAYSQALAIDPLDSYSRYNRGQMLLWAKQYAEAIRNFDASLAQRPDNLDAYRDRGIAHDRLGHLDKAAADFAKLDQAGSYQFSAFAQLAEQSIEEDDYAQTVVFATQAIRMNAPDTQALRLRAEAYWKLGELDLSQADDDAVRRIEGYLP